MRKLLLLAAAAALAFGTTAQGSAGRTTAVPPSLVGAWNRNVTSGAPIHGTWTMVVKKTGAVDFFTPGGYKPGCIAKHTCIVEFSTTYAGSGSKLNVGGLKGVFATCGAKATYSWKVAGKSLTLKAIADSTTECSGRKSLLNGVWKATKL
jgi:PPE-repeat protein